MKFKHFLGECDSKEWLSPKQISDKGVAYWLVIQILNLVDVTGDKLFASHVSVVVPEIAGDKWHDFHGHVSDASEEEKIGAIWEYGYRADLWGDTNENPLSLMLAAVEFAKTVSEYFEDFMSEPKNRLGWDGWKFCSGKY